MAKYDFFISYSSKDKEIAFKIVNAIESAGYTCWIAPRNIPYGTPYASAIMEGIDECNKFIVLITKNSVQSNDVLNEVDNAHSVKKTIIPVRLTETPLSRELNYYLSRTQWMTLPSSKPEEIVKLLNIGVAPAPVTPNDTTLLSQKRLMVCIIAAIIVIGAGVAVWLLSSDKSKNIDEKNSLTATIEEPSEEVTTSNTILSEENTIIQSEVEKKEPVRKLENKESSKEDNPVDTKSVDYNDLIFEANTYYNEKKYEQALNIYLEIAANHDINYADKVGWMYQHGEGTAVNPLKAIDWYKKAADKGNASAQNHLAELYLQGENYDKAAYYYLKADESKKLSSMSQNNLGYLYFNGLGVTKDVEKARKYWETAAKNGNAIAKSNLGKYFNE